MDMVDNGSQYMDLQGLAELKAKAIKGPEDKEILRQAAAQFESMFTQMLLKAQRDAGFGDPLFDSSAMAFYQDMHDKQMSVHMAENGGVGLADMIVAQLSGAKNAGGIVSTDLQGYFSSPVVRAPSISKHEQTWQGAEEFVQQIWPHAMRGADSLGVEPEFLVAQAVLETGWGEHVPADSRGSSFNVFGIKAQSDWSGERIWKKTLEFSGEGFESQREPFRRYQSLGDSVDDYVNFLRQNSRYQDALDTAAQGSSVFARKLGEAGYATDPDYAQKILQVIDSETMRQFRP